MKKNIFILIGCMLIILVFSIYFLYQYGIENRKKNAANMEYTSYLNKNIDGNQLMTLMNKVVDKNEKSAIDKDENNIYIETENTIRLDIKFIENEEIIPFESIYNATSSQFIKYFGSSIFKCIKIEYHDNKSVSYMIFEEQ